LEVIDLAHDAVNHLGDGLSRSGQALDAFSMTFKNLDAQLIFKLDDRLGHSWLGGIQRTSGFSQIEVTSDGLSDKAELLNIHIIIALGTGLLYVIRNSSLIALSYIFRFNHYVML